MISLIQIALFHQLSCMVILCCFLKRKMEGGLCLYVYHYSLNANMVTDAWQ